MADIAFGKSSEELRQWKTVNFPARKLGNLLLASKNFEERRDTSGQMKW